MLKKFALTAVILLAALLGFAATKPDTFRIQRTASMKAPPEKIFSVLNDMRSNVHWSPFEKDPTMKRTYSGNATGKGAVYKWQGKEAGEGRLEIIESIPSSKVISKLDFFKPFQAHNTVEFTLEGNDDATTVTWAMYGRQPYIGKVMSLFMNCDAMVGKEFETGLADLKTLVEQKK